MDRYIDNDETQTYGPKLRANLASAFASSAPPVKAFVEYLVKLQAAADKSMADGMARARGAASDLSAAARTKAPDVEAARKLLAGLRKHLGSKQDLGEWTGDIKVFFPKGLNGIGTSAADVSSALATALAGFKKDATVPDGAKLKKQVAAAAKKLTAHTEKTGGAAAAARKGLSEQSAEKKGWLTHYRGISLVAEGILTLEKRAQAVRSVVPHLGVSGGARKKTKPAKAPRTGTATP
jgi:hypothetical protein